MEPFGVKPKKVSTELDLMKMTEKDPIGALGLSILNARQPINLEIDNIPVEDFGASEIQVTDKMSIDMVGVTRLPDGTIIDNETGEVLVKPEKRSDMTLGEKLEYVFDCKMEVADLEDQIKKIKEDYAKLEWEILEEMQEKDLEKIECSRGSATSKVEPYPNIADHLSFFEWVAETKSFEFLEKRCSRAAIKDMLAREGLLPPGITTYMKSSLSVRKKSGRRK